MKCTATARDPRTVGRHRLVLMTSAILASAAAQAATADQAPPPASVPGNSLAEVVVTAQKRSENLQQVPISVQAFDTKKLEELNITDFNSAAKHLPSLSFTTFGPGQAQLYFRGVSNGTDGSRTGSVPMVGVYLDDQPVTTIGNSLDPHIYDMERIEALAGPQGTLFGASSMAGTLRYITNKPDHKGVYGGFDVTATRFKHGGTGEKIEGFLNVPLSDNLAIRLVGYGERDAGFVDNVRAPAGQVFPTSGAPHDNAAWVESAFNKVGTSGGRATLKFDLDDAWTFTPGVIYQKQGSPGSFSFQPLYGDLNTVQYGPNRNDDQWYQASLAVAGKIGNFDLNYSGGYQRRTIDNVFDYSDYSYAYDHYYASSPQYFGDYFRDNKGRPISPAQYVVSHDQFTKKTHELRISSPADARARFVAGVFYQKQSNATSSRYDVTGLGDLYSITGQPGVHYLNAVTRYDTDRAVFAQMDFDIIDKLTLTAGARVFDYRETVAGFFGFGGVPNETDPTTPFYGVGEAQCHPAPTLATATKELPCRNVDTGAKGGKYTDKVTLTYKFDPHKLVYATYSTGFRPGGINRNPNIAPYKPDYLSNYEIGWKTSWLGNTLRVNGALFREQWKDAQFGVSGQYAITQLLNSGGADIKGVEYDIEWVPADGVTLSTSGSYLYKHEMSADSCQQVPDGPNCYLKTPRTSPPLDNIIAPKGATTPVAPKFKGSATARYDFDFAEFKAHAQVTGTYQTLVIPYLSTADEAVLGPQPAYGSIDLNAGLGRNRWTTELTLTNANDSRGQLTRYLACSSSYCTIPYVVPIPPRNLTLQFSQRF